MKNIIQLMLLIMLLQACNHQGKNKTSVQVSIKYSKPENKFAGIAFANKKDMTCGMPLPAGVGDMLHYEGKIYGFCSKECKDAFLETPKAYSLK